MHKHTLTRNAACKKRSHRTTCRIGAAIAALLLCEVAAAHEVSTESKLNKLAVRVIEVQDTVNGIRWGLAATYLTAALACGGVCGIYAANTNRRVGLWFLLGCTVPVAVIPVVFMLATARAPVVNDRENGTSP